MHDDQPHAQAVQQVEVVDNAEKCLIGDHFATEGDDERLAAKGMDVRGGGANPLHEGARRGRIRGRADARDVRH